MFAASAVVVPTAEPAVAKLLKETVASIWFAPFVIRRKNCEPKMVFLVEPQFVLPRATHISNAQFSEVIWNRPSSATVRTRLEATAGSAPAPNLTRLVSRMDEFFVTVAGLAEVSEKFASSIGIKSRISASGVLVGVGVSVGVLVGVAVGIAVVTAATTSPAELPVRFHAARKSSFAPACS